MFYLGIITGLLITILTLVGLIYFRSPIERSISQSLSMVKKKGEIIEPENEEVKDWIDGMPHGASGGGGII